MWQAALAQCCQRPTLRLLTDGVAVMVLVVLGVPVVEPVPVFDGVLLGVWVPVPVGVRVPVCVRVGVWVPVLRAGMRARARKSGKQGTATNGGMPTACTWQERGVVEARLQHSRQQTAASA